MRFSFYIDTTRVFGGTINKEFDELKTFLQGEGYCFNENNYLIIQNIDINKITLIFKFFLRDKIKSYYKAAPVEYNNFRAWEELTLDDYVYKLYTNTEERKKLFYFFIFYKVLLKSRIYDVRIFIGNNIVLDEGSNPELYL